ncbi:MAG: Uma2 family endonuclease [Kofleriaceae bacterium]
MAAVVPRHRHTFLDYLQVEEVSSVKHEYLDGEIYAMAGGTPEHAALCAALIVLVGSKLRGHPCRVYTSDLRVRITATGLATYPDASVICGDPIRDLESRTHVTNPRVVFEVLSPGTEDYDRGEKREHYQQITSLDAYVVIAQDRRRIELWRRRVDRSWSHRVLGPGEALELEMIDCRVPVDELYGEAGLA